MKKQVFRVNSDGFNGAWYPAPVKSSRGLIIMLGDSSEDYMARTGAKWLYEQGLHVMAMSADKKDYGHHNYPLERCGQAISYIKTQGCEKIGEGFFGSVYRLDDETVVKVYNIPDAMKMIKRETELAKKAFMWGVPTAISYDIVKVGDKFGAVYELLHAKSIKDLIKSEKSLKAFCKKSVETLRQIHSIEVSNQELPSRREQVIEMIYDSKEFLQHQLMDKLVRIIATIPESETVLHSDFHIKNVMKTVKVVQTQVIILRTKNA